MENSMPITATRRGFLRGAAIAFAGSALARARRAEAAYPDRPVHFVVPFPPGGAVDIVARTISEQAGPLLGQTIVIDNRPGASGNIAYGFVAKSEPDGYNILIGSNNLSTNAALFGNDLSFNSETDLAPVVMIGYSPDYAIPWKIIGSGVGVVLLIALLASIAPALTVAKTEPLELLQAGRASM